MKLTWLGHSCFLLEQDGYKLVTDPYTGVEGHEDTQTEAHAVFCSHDHFDHNAVSGVMLLPKQPSPFTVRRVETCHDDQGGTLRGSNTIHIFTAGGVSVAHLGDLGHQLTEDQLTALGTVDGILIPVGGTYTVDAAAAKAVCDAVKPKWVVPMHYRHGSYDFPVLTEVEDFLALWAPAVIHRLKGPVLEIASDLAGVYVMKF